MLLAYLRRVRRNPTWGTCAGLILLAESANRTKRGGQDLIGGLDVRVNRNHFGRQAESFEADLDLPFLEAEGIESSKFHGIFIRAPVVEKVLPVVRGEQAEEAGRNDTVIAPARPVEDGIAAEEVNQPVEIMARVPDRTKRAPAHETEEIGVDQDAGNIVAVKQGNVFGTSFHPELTQDPRIHAWWLGEVKSAVLRRRDRYPVPNWSGK
ncbi:MAG: hypothetical protein LQ340_003688 [Diploschistes diacapsis]|nr:MAG: hypothetical protein LQ340_003688 [Diploschistes diacapsis]